MSSENGKISVIDLQKKGVLLVEDGNHGEYRPLKNEFCEIGTAFIRAADLSDGKISFSSAEKINTDATLRIRKGVGKAGDVLISHKGTLGKIGFAREGSPPFVCSPQTTFWRVLNEQVIDRYYLFAYMRSPQFKRVFSVCGGETDMAPYVSLTSQRSIELRLPQIRIQRAIGEIVHSLDDKIELNRKTNETLEAMAKALFKSWFVDFDPVRAKAEGRPTGLPAEISDLFPDSFEDSELGEIPRGWKIKKIGDIISRLPVGKRFDQKTVSPKGSIPVLDQSTSGIVGYHDEEAGVLATKDFPLFTFANHTCAIRYMIRPFSVIQNVFPLRGNGIDTAWLYQASQGKQEITEYKGHYPDFVEKQVVVPVNGIDKIYGGDYERILIKFDFNLINSTSLASIRDALLPKLISGELRIPDAEKMLKEVGV